MSKTAALSRFLDPVMSLLTPEVARRIVGFRADATTQARLDELAEKSNEGLLTAEERTEYEGYVRAIDLITVLQLKARSLLEKEGAVH
jgi:hypothetical protein